MKEKTVIVLPEPEVNPGVIIVSYGDCRMSQFHWDELQKTPFLSAKERKGSHVYIGDLFLEDIKRTWPHAMKTIQRAVALGSKKVFIIFDQKSSNADESIAKASGVQRKIKNYLKPNCPGVIVKAFIFQAAAAEMISPEVMSKKAMAV